jgi:ATP-dependent DNA helicase RecQ
MNSYNIYEALETYWGYKKFRPQQEEIIHSILSGNDVMAILPTGGGKSLCYQLPALLLEGVCIVVTPLIALMQDQCEQLAKKNIDALSIYSGMGYTQIRQILQQACSGQYKFLYVSPERLETNIFQEFLPAIPVSMFAIDEAHCISQWGHDFRPPYLRISNTTIQKPNVPIIALTASATQIVETEIIEKLGLHNHKKFRQSYKRENLTYHIAQPQSKHTMLSSLLSKTNGCCIVYCATRKETRQIAIYLQEHGYMAAYYHAGLTIQEREDKLKKWMLDEVPVMVCTNAFGMGIDKANVRNVIHMYVPDCIESYYQEAGRAGRDGQPANAYLLYHNNDIALLYSNITIKYPVLAYIKYVYQQLYDFLEIQVGNGMHQSCDFSLEKFCTIFKQSPLQVLGVLKVLEFEALITFNESTFLPASCQVQLGKEALHNFIATHTRYEKLLTGLLRMYGGILDMQRSINARYIAKFISMPIDYVENQLNELANMNCIAYTPVKETAQIFLLDNRQSLQHLQINYNRINERRQLALQRIEDIKAYINLAKQCYSVFIGNYFGDFDIKPCGNCDVCKQGTIPNMTATDISNLQLLLKHYAVNNYITHENLEVIIDTYHQKDFWEIINYLQDESIISIDYQNNITLLT